MQNGNLGKFFRYGSAKFSGKKNVGALVDSVGVLTNDPTRKAEILSQHFQSNFTIDNLDNCNVRGHRSGQILDNVDFTAA